MSSEECVADARVAELRADAISDVTLLRGLYFEVEVPPRASGSNPSQTPDLAPAPAPCPMTPATSLSRARSCLEKRCVARRAWAGGPPTNSDPTGSPVFKRKTLLIQKLTKLGCVQTKPGSICRASRCIKAPLHLRTARARNPPGRTWPILHFLHACTTVSRPQAANRNATSLLSLF